MARGVVCEVTPIGLASPSTPLRMVRGVVCEVTPIGLLTYFVEFFSLTDLTDLTDPFSALFRTHEEVAPPPTPPPQGGA